MKFEGQKDKQMCLCCFWRDTAKGCAYMSHGTDATWQRRVCVSASQTPPKRSGWMGTAYRDRPWTAVTSDRARVAPRV